MGTVADLAASLADALFELHRRERRLDRRIRRDQIDVRLGHQTPSVNRLHMVANTGVLNSLACASAAACRESLTTSG
jgi:hypothetical protein